MMNNDHKTTILGGLVALFVGLRDGGLDLNKLAALDKGEFLKLGFMASMIALGWYTNKPAKPAETAKGPAAGR